MRIVFAAVLALAAPAIPQAAAADVEIQSVTSPGGITAWLVENHEIPFTALELRFKGGASLDDEGKRGATNLMMATLEEGSGDMDSRTFAKAAESLAAQFSFDTGNDSVAISAQMLTENRDEAVALLRRALIEPSFPQDAVDRVRGQVRSILQSDATDPNAIASETFAKLAFGDHPYGSTLNGTEESLNALTREDLIAAKARVLAKDRLYVAAVGDITPEALGVMLDDLLGALPDTGAPMPEEASLGLTGGVTIVPYDSPQSVVIFGQEGIDIDDPEFFAAYVANQILGDGGFSSRLMDEVREKRGLTYGISSYLVPRDFAATWQGSFASANEKVAQAVEVIRDQWAKMAEGGVTEQELTEAKTYLTGAYPLRFDGNGNIAGILVGMQMDGYPIDYPAGRNAKIEAVTAEDVAAVSKRLLNKDALRFVIVGQPEGLE
ncbi:M16 family metallopeptidase [Albirhodobacter sp. R86504]|uniref:M16 family metallopeptidase n=1 Tax=Albirhodobacter sp. R86504 TaxID=3093848 RepID=UPI00367308A7